MKILRNFCANFRLSNRAITSENYKQAEEKFTRQCGVNTIFLQIPQKFIDSHNITFSKQIPLYVLPINSHLTSSHRMVNISKILENHKNVLLAIDPTNYIYHSRKNKILQGEKNNYLELDPIRPLNTKETLVDRDVIDFCYKSTETGKNNGMNFEESMHKILGNKTENSTKDWKNHLKILEDLIFYTNNIPSDDMKNLAKSLIINNKTSKVFLCGLPEPLFRLKYSEITDSSVIVEYLVTTQKEYYEKLMYDSMGLSFSYDTDFFDKFHGEKLYLEISYILSYIENFLLENPNENFALVIDSLHAYALQNLNFESREKLNEGTGFDHKEIFSTENFDKKNDHEINQESIRKQIVLDYLWESEKSQWNQQFMKNKYFYINHDRKEICREDMEKFEKCFEETDLEVKAILGEIKADLGGFVCENDSHEQIVWDFGKRLGQKFEKTYVYETTEETDTLNAPLVKKMNDEDEEKRRKIEIN